MADDAFAISPLSARPAQPTDADYEAISSAFMETARGRWFLSEFARRNRNADTRMVLDAVARIESTVAGAGVVDTGLVDALADIRSAVQESRSAALKALDPQHLEALLVPIRRGARVVREIAWRWREIGTDGRICDLLDTHASAIESGCDQVLAGDPAKVLHTAFDQIALRIDEFMRSGAQLDRDVEPKPTASPSAAEPAPTADFDPSHALDEHNAEDDAVLDMIAMEMGAPDDDIDDEGIFADSLNEPASANEVAPSHASLGAALIAGGLVNTPARVGYDPLAPLRRMTQAEKIAFFS